MRGVGITYLWASKEFPSFVRLEGKRGDYEVYVPERTCHVAMFQTCSECGAQLDGIYGNYCPNCGAKVVEQ